MDVRTVIFEETPAEIFVILKRENEEVFKSNLWTFNCPLERIIEQWIRSGEVPLISDN